MQKTSRIVIVEDDQLLSLVLANGFKKEGYEVVTDQGLGDVVQMLEKEKPDLLLLDVGLPNNSGLQILESMKGKDICPVIMLTADDSAETAVTSLKLGAYDYITKPFEMEKLKIIARNALESVTLKRTVEQYRDDAFNSTLIGESAPMRRLAEDLKKIAGQRVQNLLITGESGTGKELISRAVHNASPAHLKPFVAVNCAALPHGLLESELFGYEKGAFTDAKGLKKGLFEEAEGGTLVLDEIGDMDVSLQAKLLRVLENRTIRRIGGSKEIPFDIMVIATTNRDLNSLQQEGKFRQDLFFRLNMFSLKVPPLRERKEDIPLLSRHFLSRCTREFAKGTFQISDEALKILTEYDWPGNIRELKSLFAKICLLEEAQTIKPEHILTRLDIHSRQTSHFSVPESGLSLGDVEKNLISETMKKANGNMRKAAKLLNISYDTLRYRIKKYEIR